MSVVFIAAWTVRAALVIRAVGLVARAPGTPAEKAGRLMRDAMVTGIMLGLEFGRT